MVAQSTTTSTPAIASAIPAPLTRSPTTHSTPSPPPRARRLNPRTATPRATSSRTTSRPNVPVAPVTSTVPFTTPLLSPEPVTPYRPDTTPIRDIGSPGEREKRGEDREVLAPLQEFTSWGEHRGGQLQPLVEPQPSQR